MGQQELLHCISGKLFSLTMCVTENHTAWAHCQLPCPWVERHLYDSSSNTQIAPDHIPSCFYNSTFSCEEKDWEYDFQWKMINLLYTGTQIGDFSVALSILKCVCKMYIWNNYTEIKMFLDNSKISFTIMLSQSLQRLPNHITMKTKVLVDFINYICHLIYNLFCLFTLFSSRTHTSMCIGYLE